MSLSALEYTDIVDIGGEKFSLRSNARPIDMYIYGREQFRGAYGKSFEEYAEKYFPYGSTPHYIGDEKDRKIVADAIGRRIESLKQEASMYNSLYPESVRNVSRRRLIAALAAILQRVQDPQYAKLPSGPSSADASISDILRRLRKGRRITEEEKKQAEAQIEADNIYSAVMTLLDSSLGNRAIPSEPTPVVPNTAAAPNTPNTSNTPNTTVVPNTPNTSNATAAPNAPNTTVAPNTPNATIPPNTAAAPNTAAMNQHVSQAIAMIQRIKEENNAQITKTPSSPITLVNIFHDMSYDMPTYKKALVFYHERLQKIQTSLKMLQPDMKELGRIFTAPSLYIISYSMSVLLLQLAGYYNQESVKAVHARMTRRVNPVRADNILPLMQFLSYTMTTLVNKRQAHYLATDIPEIEPALQTLMNYIQEDYDVMFKNQNPLTIPNSSQASLLNEYDVYFVNPRDVQNTRPVTEKPTSVQIWKPYYPFKLSDILYKIGASKWQQTRYPMGQAIPIQYGAIHEQTDGTYTISVNEVIQPKGDTYITPMFGANIYTMMLYVLIGGQLLLKEQLDGRRNSESHA